MISHSELLARIDASATAMQSLARMLAILRGNLNDAAIKFEPLPPSSQLAETADSVANQMDEWVEELEPITRVGGPFLPIKLHEFCCGVKAAFKDIAGDLHRAIEQHEKQEAAKEKDDEPKPVVPPSWARDSADLMSSVSDLLIGFCDRIEAICQPGSAYTTKDFELAVLEFAVAAGGVVEKLGSASRSLRSNVEPHTIICWTEGAVVHDVSNIPPGVRVVFHDCDTESSDDDCEIHRDPVMGEYVVLGPYASQPA